MKYSSALFFLLTACCASIACSDDSRAPSKIGGACEYRQINGRAAITSVGTADPAAYNCRDAVEVVFTFIPDEPSAPRHYRFPGHPDTGHHFRVGGGMNPPRAWARSKGLVQGRIHRCIRSELIKGACTPVVFTFPDLDMEGWEKPCFE